MRLSTSAAFALAAFLATPCLVWAHGEGRDPAAILRAARVATGGRALDAKDGAYEEGRHGDTTYRTWLDFKHYGMKSESLRDGKRRTVGFNGSIQWTQGPDGAVTVKSDADSLREAVTTAYVSNNGYFYPERFPASFRYVRLAREHGRSFDVVEASPKGSRPAEFWIDRRTHLIVRIVDNDGKPPVSVEISDYRKLDGTRVAFRGIVRTLDGKVVDRVEVKSVTYRRQPRAVFEPPATTTH
ncbi:MAG TPA: hypothetical protein VG407_02880 [Caulobacteraceae bacterium]|jgi:hypothetical protein|nr:hypothetical protein [Caulobacteraceae bacterium]